MPDHQYYMHYAMQQANKAFAKHEVPIGAVVVDGQGTIIARAYNQVEKEQTQSAHAEVLALRKAGKRLGNWRLTDCWLYVTLEPCSMCMCLALLSRVKGIVYGASSPVFGHQLDKYQPFWVYKSEQFDITMVPGIGAQESADILRRFFHNQREKSRG